MNDSLSSPKLSKLTDKTAVPIEPRMSAITSIFIPVLFYEGPIAGNPASGRPTDSGVRWFRGRLSSTNILIFHRMVPVAAVVVDASFVMYVLSLESFVN